MTYREGLARDEPVGPAWIDLAAEKLSPAAERRLKEHTSEGVLARSEPRRSGPASAFVQAIVLALAVLALLVFLRVGIVESAHGSNSFLAALGYGAIAAFVVRMTFAAARRRQRPKFWLVQGRILVPGGIVEADGMHVRIAPADRIASIDVVNAQYFPHLLVRLDDGEQVMLPVRRGALASRQESADRVLARAEDIRRARALGDTRELERLELLSRAQLDEARTTPKPPTRTAPAGAISLVAGLAIAALAFLVILPELSIAWTPRSASVDRWQAIARAYPFSWVTSRTDAAVLRRRTTAHETILARVAPEHRDAIRRALEWLASHDASALDIDVVPAPSSTVALTSQLAARAPEGRTTGPVTLRVQFGIAYVDRPGSQVVAEALSPIFSGPADVIDLSTAMNEDVAASDRARLVLALDARVTDALVYQDAVVAALELTFTPRIELPGEAPISLGEPIVTPPIDGWSLLVPDRERIWDEYTPLEQILYARQIERGARRAGYVLRERLTVAVD